MVHIIVDFSYCRAVHSMGNLPARSLLNRIYFMPAVLPLRAAVALLCDKYLVTGLNARISFGAGKDLKDRGMILDRVEEGRFENGK